MSRSADYRLEELFVRYWDDVLTPAEADELQRRLARDPAAREAFQLFCLQAVVAADLPTASGKVSDPPATLPLPAPARPPWSRRRFLGYLGGGLAACALAGVLGRRYLADLGHGVQLVTAGAVTVRSADGALLPLGGPVPANALVAVSGIGSSAVLTYPDGTRITLLSDSEARVGEKGEKVVLRQGTATAHVPLQAASALSLTLVTSEASLSNLGGAVLTLGRLRRGTEVGVHKGQVRVAEPSGESPELVKGGELLTVEAGGERHKQRLPATPDRFAWDLSRPLPAGWHVGRREVTPDGPVVRPEFWFDPYHSREMYQVRSDHQWTRGFFRLFPDSRVRVRYWVNEPGPSQVVLVVRTDNPAAPETGVIECNGAFMHARPREWQWLEVKASDMLDNRHTPRFGAPWVAFLVIFNTYETDLDLKIAEFRVVPPPGAPEA